MRRRRAVPAFGHGLLAAVHGLGVIWHLSGRTDREARLMATYHASALAVDLVAAWRHASEGADDAS